MQTVTTTAKVCGVPATTIRRWVAQDRLASRRSHGRLLVDPLHVLELVDTRHDGRIPRVDKRHDHGARCA